MTAAHVVSISGGKDSTACYLLALERRERTGRPFRAVWADTCHEHPLTVEYIRTLPQRTGGPGVERVVADFSAQIARKREFVATKWREQGIPEARVERALAVLRPTGHPFVDLTLWKGRFPSTKAQFCTDFLKARPIQDQVLVPALRGGSVIQWLGIRREESRRRAETPVIRRVRWSDPKATLVYFCPLAAWGWEDVFAIHERHGIRPNPLYAQGARRVGCWPCIHAGKAELTMIQRVDPEAVERLLEWEALVAEASKRGAATFFAADVTPEGAEMARRGVIGAEGGEKYPRADVVFQWARTSRGGRQLPLFEPGCASEYGLCE